MDEEVNEQTPQVSSAQQLWWNWQHNWWALEHWSAVYLCGLRFCHSCGGYFRAPSMVLPDKCEACYARDYGVSVTHSAADITSPFTSDRE